MFPETNAAKPTNTTVDVSLLGRINEPAESAVRVNTLATTVERVVEALPVGAHPAQAIPEGLVVDGPFDAHGSPLFAAGAVMPQARASMLVAPLAGPRPGRSGARHVRGARRQDHASGG